MTAPKRLPDWFVGALSDGLRDRLRGHERQPGQLVLHFASGAIVDIGLARESTRAFVRRGPLNLGYRVDGEGGDTLCLELAELLTDPVADKLAAYLDEAIARPERDPLDGPRATMMLTEHDVLRGRSLAELARATQVDAVELYLHEAVCVQHCQFCAYPRVRARRRSVAAQVNAGLRVLGQRATGSAEVLDWLDAVIAIMRARPGASVTLSGPDFLRHPQIEAILERLAAAPELGVELLGPMTRLAEPVMFARVAAVPGLRAIHTSLLSTTAATHDAIVGVPGAHAQVLAALTNCRAREIPVMLNLVVVPANVEELPELLALCVELGASNVRVSLYHPESAHEGLIHESWRELDVPALVVSREAMLRAWASTPSPVLGHVHGHYLAHCWVPEDVRELLLRTPSDRQDNFTYLSACAACPARERCPGVTVPAAERFGPDAASALTASQDPRNHR